MSQRRANDAVASLLRLSSACRSIALSRNLTNCSRSRLLSTTTLCRPIRRRNLGYAWSQNRRLSHDSEEAGPNVAVIGGGLTGLTTAYYLARGLPSNAKITLFEATDRLGGWVKTDRVPVDVSGVKGIVNFERGPRTLSSLRTNSWRYDDLVLYDLALNLGLKTKAPPDQPRYIYYPDHLVTLPPTANLADFVLEPLVLESLMAAFGFILRRLRRNAFPTEDVSITEWIRDVTGSDSVANNMASAMIHGIYGGNVDKLSAISVLDNLYWSYYLRDLGHGIQHMPAHEEQLLLGLGQDPEIQKLAMRAKGTLLHFGENGMDSLTNGLIDALKSQPNVNIRLNQNVQDIRYKGEDEVIEILTGAKTQTTEKFDKVISTIPSQTLARIANDKLDLLHQTESVSIMTVNIWYPQKNMKPPGFGYLIPRSVSQRENPAKALGVFFDSDVGVTGPDEPEGTKLFVLMGGHYYSEGHPIPTPDEAIAQAKSLIERHLGIPHNTPCFAMASLAQNCIPQHYVGHRDLMLHLRGELLEHFGGRLAVAGGSYTKIGAMGAIRAGYDIAERICADVETGSIADSVGLETIVDQTTIVQVPTETILVRKFPKK